MYKKKFAGLRRILFFESYLLFMDKMQNVAPGQHFHLKPQLYTKYCAISSGLFSYLSSPKLHISNGNRTPYHQKCAVKEEKTKVLPWSNTFHLHLILLHIQSYISPTDVILRDFVVSPTICSKDTKFPVYQPIFDFNGLRNKNKAVHFKQ